MFPIENQISQKEIIFIKSKLSIFNITFSKLIKNVSLRYNIKVLHTRYFLMLILVWFYNY